MSYWKNQKKRKSSNENHFSIIRHLKLHLPYLTIMSSKVLTNFQWNDDATFGSFTYLYHFIIHSAVWMFGFVLNSYSTDEVIYTWLKLHNFLHHRVLFSCNLHFLFAVRCSTIRSILLLIYFSMEFNWNLLEFIERIGTIVAR